MIYWARAIGSAHLRKPDDVRKDIARHRKHSPKACGSRNRSLPKAVEERSKEAQAWLAFAEGKDDDAVEALRRSPTRKIRWATNLKAFQPAK